MSNLNNNANTPGRNINPDRNPVPLVDSPSTIARRTPNDRSQREEQGTVFRDHRNHQRRRGFVNSRRRLFEPDQANNSPWPPSFAPPPPPNEEHDREGTHSRLEDMIRELSRRVESVERKNDILYNRINALTKTINDRTH
tara:strand:- start:182 stop:601 length:420 start_codon:yes stop_codon:yes gene_type:complete